MKKLINITFLCTLLIINTIVPLYAESFNTFNLQKFLNSNKMSDFINKYEYGDYKPGFRLFLVQKSSKTPFNSFDLNEADEFFLSGYSGYSIFFDRNYTITKTSEFSTLNIDMNYYEIGVYPIQLALKQIITQCHLENESLTNFAINHPASLKNSIIYIFTTRNKMGKCMQSTFDTYQKSVDCKVTLSSCYKD